MRTLSSCRAHGSWHAPVKLEAANNVLATTRVDRRSIGLMYVLFMSCGLRQSCLAHIRADVISAVRVLMPKVSS